MFDLTAGEKSSVSTVMSIGCTGLGVVEQAESEKVVLPFWSRVIGPSMAKKAANTPLDRPIEQLYSNDAPGGKPVIVTIG